MRTASPIAALRRLTSLAAAAGADSADIERCTGAIFEGLAAIDLRKLAAHRLAKRVHEIDATGNPLPASILAARMGVTRQRIQQIRADKYTFVKAGADWPP
jgi:hypothetical protein